jgi:hypothetical protein
MGNNMCCKSKKQNRGRYDADLYAEGGLTGEGGITGQNAGYSSIDTLMYKYVDDILGEPEKDVVGVITFEYFLRLYKTALIWNRVQFADKKKLLIA